MQDLRAAGAAAEAVDVPHVPRRGLPWRGRPARSRERASAADKWGQH